MELEGFTRKELLELSWEKPVMAQIELTHNCNHSCLFCFRSCSSTVNKCPDLKVEQWKKIIRKLKNLGIRKLNFSGGENFLYADFLKVVRWAKDEGFEIAVNTNGTFSCKKIVSYVDEIIFSVHGLGEMHNRIVQKRGDFDLVKKNAFEIADKVNFSINMVLVEMNFQQIVKVFSYFNKKCKLFKFSPTIAIKSRFGNPEFKNTLSLNKDIIENYRAGLKQIPDEQLSLKHGFQSIYYNNPSVYASSVIPLPNCAGGKYKLVIDYDGSVYPCNFFKGKEFYCGNILTGNEFEIWQEGKGFKRFRNLIMAELVPEECRSCLKLFKCFSGCRAWALEYSKGGFENARDIRCELGDSFIGNRSFKQMQS